jgi:ORF6N domain
LPGNNGRGILPQLPLLSAVAVPIKCGCDSVFLGSFGMSLSVVPKPENLASIVLFLRGDKVLLDTDLASLYGVETKALNQAVTRNRDRFPDDFMFRLSPEEGEAVRRLRSQNVTLKRGQHSKYLPRAFTEQGVAMLSSVLRSPRLRLRNCAQSGVCRMMPIGRLAVPGGVARRWGRSR